MSVVEHAISLPFRFTVAGAIEATSDQNKIWADRVLSVIGTTLGERMHAHTFGTKIYDQVFSTVTEASSGIIEGISKAFATWLPTLTLDNVITDYNEFTNQLFIEVRYKLPNNQDSQLTLGSVVIQTNSPIKEN